MSPKKLIVVFGATGMQGGGLARAILQDRDGEFSVRGVMRDVNSEKAKALASLGAEVVAANLDEPDTVERALEGAYGAYLVTFYWDHFSPEKEKAHAAVLANAAKKANLKHAIWSTLEDTREYIPLHDERMPTLMGQYKVPHFDGKGESDKLFTQAGIPVTFLRASFYWENFIFFGSGPKQGPDGRLALTLPIGQSKMAGVAAEDIGKCALGIFKKNGEVIGKTIGIAGGYLTGEEMAKAMSKALKKEVVYNAVTPAVYRSFGFPGADDLGNMFQFYDEFANELNTIRDVDLSRKLNPALQSFDQWLEKNAERMPLT